MITLRVMPTHLRRYDEPGESHFWTISCRRRPTCFHDDGLKPTVAEGLRVLQQRFGVCLIGYVIMPEHVHVIVYPHARGNDDPIPVSRLLYAFKKHVGFHGKQRLRDVWRVQGGLWSQPLNAWATGDKNRQTICNIRGYDFNVRTHKALLEKLDRCHKNPLTRAPVDRAEDWPWNPGAPGSSLRVRRRIGTENGLGRKLADHLVMRSAHDHRLPHLIWTWTR